MIFKTSIGYIVFAIVVFLIVIVVKRSLRESFSQFQSQEYRTVDPDPRYSWLSQRMFDHSTANELPFLEWPRKVDKITDIEQKYHILTPEKFQRYSIGVTVPKERKIQKGYLKGWPETTKDVTSAWIDPTLLDYEKTFKWYSFDD